MSELLSILLATIAVSLISFVGAGTLLLSEKVLKKILLVGFAAGTLIGGAFLHLLPESIELGREIGIFTVFSTALVGFILFFILEKILWRHCHERACPIHVFAYLNLLGDGIHNFVDGVIIAAGFLVSPWLGLITTLAVAAHEVPQELGDFGVLVYGGLKPRRALFLNFVTALTAVVGGAGGYYILPLFENAKIFLLPFAAGGFLYIAASDLIPELHKEGGRVRPLISFVSFMLGIILMWSLRLLFETH
ncbi:MAG: ZIP family metal transporter [Candidatus Hadarchaeales archaeon]